MKSTVSLKYLLIIAVIISLMMSTSGIILAENGVNFISKEKQSTAVEKNIELTVKTKYDEEVAGDDIEENTAELTWKLKDDNTDIQQYKYTVERSIGDSKTYSAISNINDRINVLNVYPGDDKHDKITFNTYDDDAKKEYYMQNGMVEGGQLKLDKAASLKEWMEKSVNQSSNGFGKGLIEVTPVSISDFNQDPEKYLKDEVHALSDVSESDNNDYKYDVIFFGSWDSYGGAGNDLKGNHQDSESETGAQSSTLEISTTDDATTIVENFIKKGGNVIFGHDTVCLTSGQHHPNLAYLGKEYVNITCSKDGGSSHSNTDVYIHKDGVFTSYPWDITEGKSKDETDQKIHLTIPTAHNLGQTANGDIWLKFKGNNSEDDKTNFYLTTYEKPADSDNTYGMCAMIQTGHSSGTATDDEEKIIANLIFYVSTVDDITANLTDHEFTDRNGPTISEVSSDDITINKENATVKISATDEGTTYHYYVEGENKTDSTKKIESEKIEKIRPATGVKKYEYYTDGNDVDETNEEEKNKVLDYFVNPTNHQDIKIQTLEGDGIEDSIENIKLESNVTYLHIRAIDNAGNAGEVKTIKIYENTAPSVTLSQEPTEWTNTKDNNTVKITAIGTDTDGYVAKIEKINDDGSADALNVGTNSEKNNPFEYDFHIKENGTYKFRATDNLGATSTIENIDSAIIISNIDNNAPEINDINVVQPTNTNQYAEISFSAEDKETTTDSKDISGISKIEIVYKGIDGTSEESVVGEIYTTKTQDSENRVTGPNSFNTTDLQDADKIKLTKSGKYVIKVTDVAGNETISDEVEVKIESLGIKVKYQDVLHPELDDLSAVVDTNTTNPNALSGEEYTTKFEEIAGYELVGISIYDSNGTLKETINPIPADKNITIEYEIGAQTVVYEYKKVSKVTTVYEDANTNTNIDKNEEANYKEGDTYIVNPKDITGYVLTESPKETTGIMGRDDITKVYHYRKISEGLTVKYVDKSTGDLLGQLELKEKDGRQLGEGDIVDLLKEKTILEKNKEIEGKGYKNISKALIVNNNEKEIKDEEADITLTTEGTEVIYYYTKEITIQVVGIDEKTGKEIYSSSTLKGLEGENYKITPPEIKGYKLDSKKMPKNAQGKYNRNDTKVVYYYNKIAGGVTVKYVDENNNEIAKREIITGVVDEEYRAPYKDIDKYILTSVDGDTIGKMNEDVIDVTFHYKKRIGKVEVQYVDENGNILHKEEIENYVGEKYQTTKKDFKNYDYNGVEGIEEGYIEDGISTITYYYKTKQKDTTPKTGESNIINIVELITALSIAGIVIIKRKLK